MTKDIFDEVIHHILAEAKIGHIECRVGLCMVSQFTDIMKRIKKYQDAIDQYQNTDTFLQALKNKKNIKDSKFKPYWHILHKNAVWFTKIQKEEQIAINILTELTPYSDKSLKLNVGGVCLYSSPFETQINVQFLELLGHEKLIKKTGTTTKL